MTAPTPTDDAIEFELDIDYLGAFEDEMDDETVNATAVREGDTITITTDDGDELRLTAGESVDEIVLRAQYRKDGLDRDKVAYVRDRDPCTLSVSWSRHDQHVDEITLPDAAGDMALDLLDEARDAQDHMDVETAWTATGVWIPDLDLRVVETTVYRGRRNSTTELTVVAADDTDDEDWEQWRDIVQRAGSLHTTHYKSHVHPPEDAGYEAGDDIGLHDLIDEWHALDAHDVATEAELADLDLGSDLVVGDIVTVTSGRHSDDYTEREGVIRDIDDDGRAEITWDGHTWSVLKHDDSGQLVVGRGGGYAPVRALEIADGPEDVDDPDEIEEIVEDVREQADIAAKASTLDVAHGKQWTTGSATEASRGSDLHAEVVVDGPALDEPVECHLRNVFDVGWTCSIRADLDEQTAAVVRQAAREDSPIPTGVRL